MNAHGRVTAALSLMAIACVGCGDSDPRGAGGSAGSGGTGIVSGSGGGAGSGDAGSGDAGSGGGSPVVGEPDFSLPPGRIQVTTWLEFGETALGATFLDGPIPRQLEEAERIGSCRLMRSRPTTCTPSCEGGSVCVSERCETFPMQLNRGPIEWSWPGGQQTVSASATGNYSGVGQASTTGEVTVVVAGVTLSAPSDESPSPEGDWLLGERAAGESVALRWTNPSPGARVRLHMTDCAGTHGGLPRAEIECEGADTGEIVLPGAFLDELDLGDWSRGECGSHRLQRYHTDGDDQLRLETIATADFFYGL